MSNEYHKNAIAAKEKLGLTSKSMCLAKWLQVSMHLPQGLTQSCYHPPTHHVDINNLKKSKTALHNTPEKIKQRQEMLDGKRPSGCEYCWKIEDASNGPHLSDRHYKSGERWAAPHYDNVIKSGTGANINPTYVEVNFNQACNLKCVYCSPHLSTAWEKEINKHGDFKFSSGYRHNNIESLKQQNLMPIVGANKDNPYVTAFWEWWPELYETLEVFRMTGGEPLMDKNTFKVLDYVNNNPNAAIELSITSNMCPPDNKLLDKFLELLTDIERPRIWEDKNKINPNTNNNWFISPACKHFSLYVSVDSVGAQAEYIRSGLDFDIMKTNVNKVLDNTHNTTISFINTFNILSLPRLKEFLQFILDLRVKYGKEYQPVKHILPDNAADPTNTTDAYEVRPRQKIWFDMPFLQFPNWLDVQNLSEYPEYIAMVEDAIAFMNEHKETDDYHNTFHGFKEHEIAKLSRNLEVIKNGRQQIDDDALAVNKKMFYEYVTQLDARRNTSFIETFPELSKWYDDCKNSV